MRYIKNLLDPDTSSMNSQGFKPNYLILLLRFISKIIIRILRLNGRTRWSNEFIQSIDPMIEIEVPSLNASKKKIKFGSEQVMVDFIGELDTLMILNQKQMNG